MKPPCDQGISSVNSSLINVIFMNYPTSLQYHSKKPPNSTLPSSQFCPWSHSKLAFCIFSLSGCCHKASMPLGTGFPFRVTPQITFIPDSLLLWQFLSSYCTCRVFSVPSLLPSHLTVVNS